MATKLEKLSIEELSGVENPANETPGWLVMKSADDREALLKEVDRMESDFAILYAALKAVEPYLADAPEDVTAAHTALVSYVESLFGSDEENTEPSPDAGETEVTPVKQSADSNTRSLMSVIFGEKIVKDAELEAEDAFAEDVEVEKTDDVEEPAAEATETDEAVADEPVAEADEAVAEEAPELVAGVEKSEDDSEELIAVLQRIAKAQEEAAADSDALRGAITGIIERVERLEVRKTGLDPDLDEAMAKNTVDPLRAAVHSALSGNRVTIT